MKQRIYVWVCGEEYWYKHRITVRGLTGLEIDWAYGRHVGDGAGWAFKGEQRIGNKLVIYSNCTDGHDIPSFIVYGARTKKEAHEAVKQSKWKRRYIGNIRTD